MIDVAEEHGRRAMLLTFAACDLNVQNANHHMSEALRHRNDLDAGPLGQLPPTARFVDAVTRMAQRGPLSPAQLAQDREYHTLLTTTLNEIARRTRNPAAAAALNDLNNRSTTERREALSTANDVNTRMRSVMLNAAERSWNNPQPREGGVPAATLKQMRALVLRRLTEMNEREQ